MVSAYMHETKSLKFLHLSRCPGLGFESKGMEYTIEGLLELGEQGLLSLKLDSLTLPVPSLDVFARPTARGNLHSPHHLPPRWIPRNAFSSPQHVYPLKAQQPWQNSSRITRSSPCRPYRQLRHQFSGSSGHEAVVDETA